MKILHSSLVLCMLVVASLMGDIVLAQDNDSFLELMYKRAKKKGLIIPKDLEKKAFEFVPIVKPGQTVTFKMGSNNLEKADEGPVHDVTLTRAFEIQRTETTCLQWALVTGSLPLFLKADIKRKDGKVRFSGREDGKKEAYLLYNGPVTHVSYDEVLMFINELNSLDTKYTYRLPTEAEWEYAARAGDTAEYTFVDELGLLADYAWYSDNSKGRAHNVALKSPRAGLYDMLGNLSEWVSDYYESTTYSDVNSYLDPEGPCEGYNRVLRGCAWYCNSTECSPTSRSSSSYNYKNGAIGFRLVRTAKN